MTDATSNGLLWDGPLEAPTTVLLAHGAGAPMDNRGMTDLAVALAERGFRVARFEFGYMAARRSGTRKPPPRADTLTGEYRAAVDAVRAAGASRLLIGGRSMGGRVATLVADELHTAGLVSGVVCFGYPFHPPAKPEQLRTAHLEHLETPTLIVQGERDEFGTRSEVEGYPLSPAIDVLFLPDGDHSLTPRKSVSGFGYRDHLATAADAVARFAAGLA